MEGQRRLSYKDYMMNEIVWKKCEEFRVSNGLFSSYISYYINSTFYINNFYEILKIKTVGYKHDILSFSCFLLRISL